MRIVLRVTSSNEYNDGGCEFALVDLTPELAALALQRIAMLREQKTLDPNIDEAHYWAYFVTCYFSPYAGLAIDDKEVEGKTIALEDMLDNFHIEEKEIVTVPGCFQVPSSRVAAVECEKMLVRELCGRPHKERYVAKSVMWHSFREAALKENRFLPNAT
jgi:hypothetical protein